MKLSQLLEAKHISNNPEGLLKDLVEMIWDAYEFVYIDDFDNNEDYLDAIITKIMKEAEKMSPPNLKKAIPEQIWSSYHDFDESEFANTESLVDAMINQIVDDLRFTFMRQYNVGRSIREIS